MCHVSNQKFEQFRYSNFIVITSLLLNTLSAIYLGKGFVDEVVLIHIALIASVLSINCYFFDCIKN